MARKVAKIGRKLGERVRVEGPCEFCVKEDPRRKNRWIVEIETEEGVEVSRAANLSEDGTLPKTERIQ